MAQNGNRAKRKCHTSFFVFDLLKMKFVPIDSALNSAQGNESHSFQKVGVVPRKAAKLEKVVRNLKKASFDSTKIKTGKWLGQTLFIFETPGIVAPAWARLDFDSDP